MKNSETERFERNLDWVIGIFKSQDVLVMNAFKLGTKNFLQTEFFKEVLVTAINYLAASDPETFYWALRHLDPQFYLDMKRDIVVEIVTQLISQGCILGEDFSATPTGNLIINQKAVRALADTPYIWSTLLLKEVLHKVS